MPATGEDTVRNEVPFVSGAGNMRKWRVGLFCIGVTITLGRTLRRPEGLRGSSWEGQLLGLDKREETHVGLCVRVCTWCSWKTRGSEGQLLDTQVV